MSKKMHSIIFILMALFSGLVGCGGGCSGGGSSSAQPESTPSPQAAVLEQVFPSLSFAKPVFMLQAPGDSSRWYLVEQSGIIRIFENRNDISTTSVFINLTPRVDSGKSESGLLGMAFDPDFAKNGYVYLSYTGQGSPLVSYISRFTSPDGGKTLNNGSEKELIVLNQPYENHNGGCIEFGPDGYLYIGFGDGGSGGDPQGNAQNKNTLLGKILRIDVNGGDPYAIPPDNPFVSGGGKPEILAYGLRNPWRFSFDRKTGDLWAADVGQSAWEEIDHIEKGGNYGWNIREGAHPYADGDTSGLIDPVAEYSHDDGISVTGGYVYRGSAYPELNGVYIYGDFGSGKIWGIYDPYGSKPTVRLLVDSDIGISSFAQGNDGEIYALDYSSGKIYHLRN